MTKDNKQDKIEQTKEEFLKDLKSDELEILDDTAGGVMSDSNRRIDDGFAEGNNWCDSGC